MPPNQPSQYPQPQQQPPLQQPVGPQDYSIDYLNQISGPYKPPSVGPSKFVMIFAAVIGLFTVIGFVLMLLTSGPSGSDRALEIYLRINTLKTIAEEQQSNLRDNDLRGLNSNLTLQLTNALGESAEPLGAVGVDTASLPKALPAEETALSEELTATFEEAELNVRLDSVYAREMSFQLATLRAMMESAYRQSNSEAFKTYLDATANELQPLTENFSNFITD